MKINCTVFQDGADFYVTTEDDQSGGAYHWRAPFHVSDHDMEGAELARSIFIAAFEKSHNISWEE